MMIISGLRYPLPGKKHSRERPPTRRRYGASSYEPLVGSFGGSKRVVQAGRASENWRETYACLPEVADSRYFLQEFYLQNAEKRRVQRQDTGDQLRSLYRLHIPDRRCR